ncbi:pilin N-terminal domain-containing protein [Peptoniphilus harei]|uniref:pilin N-terminal domain-containing protein n=1 Tax=Peptoniphilus harei TaxID=54005 RepID=UPI0025910E1E|nr:pilin N-terminal domain-containing protein [Peptoniphilus harei]MDU6743481.1 pilin N-terminal domain-containing protein [Peptoniphilus harei]
MNKKKIMSLIMALVMLVGVFSPLTALAANDRVTEPTGTVGKDQLQDTKPTETTVNLYKLTTKTKYKFDKPLNHTGGKIDPKEYANLGADVEALAGAQFTFYKINGENDVENEKILELLKANQGSFKTVAQMNDLIAKGKTDLTPSKVDKTLNKIDAGKLALAEGTGLTDGHTADTAEGTGLATVTLADGYYWVIESKAPAKVTGQKAVPFGLTLPLTNAYDVEDESGKIIAKAGTKYLNPVHIYPKNIETNDVKIDKNFLKEKTGNMTDAEFEQFKKDAIASGYTEDKIKQWQADINNYDAEKAKIALTVGTKAPYDIVTEIPQNYNYTSMSWSDIMSKGLTFNNDLKVTVSQEGQEDKVYDFSEGKTVTGATYTQGSYGFDLTFDENGDIMKAILAKAQNGAVKIRLQYSATVNNKTVADDYEHNKVSFTPGKPNPGQKVKPADNKIEVTKDWTDKDGKAAEAPAGVEVTYFLINSKGEVVDSYTKKSTEQDKDFSHTFNIDEKIANDTFTVREVVRGYEASYKSEANGKVSVTNKNKPDVLVPTNPEVTTGGKKFVKADKTTGERLTGAEFEVYNAKKDGQVLAYVSTTEAAAKKQAVTDAKKALDTAIDKYNNLSATEQEGDAGKQAKTAINEAQKKYNDAVVKAAEQYKWVEKNDTTSERVKLVSDGQGKFEITGLAYGTYYLQETKAPKGYALNEARYEFKIAKGSYKATEGGVTYESDDPVSDTTVGGAQRIDNKKVTIPQTGGIGTVLFTIVGISLMAGAVVAMKRNREEA